MAHPLAGQQLGRYEVVALLAVGGMAEIFLGRVVGPAGFERVVVIKRILPHLADVPAFVDMFVDEARIVAGLHHPNVVVVHELVREAGELLLVMEYVEGETLGTLLRRLSARGEVLAPALAMYIIAEACAGLHAAHELVDEHGLSRQLVHRDVTPNNVMITYDGQIKVLDFGIAKAVDRIARTDAGQIKGTFPYMSPEQCEGQPLDRRSDIFSLGTLLWEASTGQRLFERPADLLVLKAICEEPIPRPSSRVDDYPEALEAICLRALEQRRGNRYSTAAEMRRDLLATSHARVTLRVPDEALAALMQDLFADRLAEKREVLRRLRTGGAPLALPAAEEAAATVAARGARPQRSRTRPVLLVAAAVLGGTAWLWTRTPSSSAGPVAATSPVATASPPDAMPAPFLDAPALAREVTIEVVTTPPRARVQLDGRDLGFTPLAIQVPRTHTALELRIRRAGFRDIDETLVPDVDHRLRLTLVPRARDQVRPVRSPQQREFPRFP